MCPPPRPGRPACLWVPGAHTPVPGRCLQVTLDTNRLVRRSQRGPPRTRARRRPCAAAAPPRARAPTAPLCRRAALRSHCPRSGCAGSVPLTWRVWFRHPGARQRDGGVGGPPRQRCALGLGMRGGSACEAWPTACRCGVAWHLTHPNSLCRVRRAGTSHLNSSREGPRQVEGCGWRRPATRQPGLVGQPRAAPGARLGPGRQLWSGRPWDQRLACSWSCSSAANKAGHLRRHGVPPEHGTAQARWAGGRMGGGSFPHLQGATPGRGVLRRAVLCRAALRRSPSMWSARS